MPGSEAGRSFGQGNAERILLLCFLGTQGVHLATCILLPLQETTSNVLQTVGPVLATLLCAVKATTSEKKQERWIWLQLASAFLIYAAAQGIYTYALLVEATHQPGPVSDALWFFFALPLLLVASSSPGTSSRDLVGWFDTGQACAFFLVIFALVYPRPELLQLSTVYNVQSVALLLAFAIRYSTSKTTAESAFYRRLAAFTLVYACSTLLYYHSWPNRVFGRAADLTWTFPFTLFGILMIKPNRGDQKPWGWTRGLLAQTHLRGVSALGLAVMSLAGSSVLIRYHPVEGAATMAASFLLFAARTSTREWQLQSMQTGLEHSVLHDPLTGLANRRMLQKELGQRLDADFSNEKRPSLLFIDLDRFKTINDALGHAFGDLLLIRVAELLKATARERDVVGRHGGDEFVVLLDRVNAQEAELLAQAFAEALRTPFSLDGCSIHVTASIGIVLGNECATADGMLQDADCAMYKAKGMGRDCVQVFIPEMLSAAKTRLDLETELRRTLAQEGVDVYYQPIYALQGPTITGFEALARWNNPMRGMVPPDQFIPLAEEAGLIVELGRQVLRQACFQCSEWNRRTGLRLTVAVNVSARQFAHQGLLKELAEALHDSRLEPALLKLEITESVLLSGYAVVDRILGSARAMGIRVCLDDFGTGYSSLSYLLRFPFDVIKVDRSFVQHLDCEYRKAEMVRLVVQLAAVLNKKVIAEGVETIGELKMLRKLGCDHVQGFLLSKPLSADAVETLLQSEHLLSVNVHEPGSSRRSTPPDYPLRPSTREGSRRSEGGANVVSRLP